MSDEAVANNDTSNAGPRQQKWQQFREQADADWQLEVEEEIRICRDVLPSKAIPFPSPVRYPELIVERDTPVPMRDGVKLQADVYRPKAEGQFPVVINRGPYDRTSSLDNTPAVARNLAQRGYICIAQDARGRYGSEGEYEPLKNEIEDGVDTVEWAGTQPWSSGKVGMFGISYNGFVQLCAAIGQASHLSCIFPGMIGYGFDSRERGVQWLQSFGGWYIWAGQGRECLNPLRIDTSHLPVHEIDDKAGYSTENFDALAVLDRSKQLPGEIPAATVAERLASIRTPTYYVAGWYDELLENTLDTWQKISIVQPNTRLMIGPWHHNLCDIEEPRMGKVATPDVELKRYYEQMEMFFAQHLNGEENEVSQNEAPIKMYVMGCNKWRDEYEWPLARTTYETLYAHSGGNAAADLEDGLLSWEAPVGEQPADEYNYDPNDPVSWSKTADVWAYLNDMGDRADIESRDDVLVYSTAPLDRDIEVTGAVKAVVFAASDCEDTDFAVNLIDVHPDGHTQYLTHSIVRARFRNGMDSEELIEPGKVYRYEIDLWPTCNAFLKGHQIRFEITSSDLDRYARNQNIAGPLGQTAETRVAHQTVFHDSKYQTHFVIPVIPEDS